MSMQRTLEIMKGQMHKHRIKNSLIVIKQDINSGASLSQSMARHPDVFSSSYVASVRAGEAGNDLVRALSTMGSFLEWLDETAKELMGVLLYPLMVIVALTILSMVLAFYAIPTFMKLYEQLGLQVKTPLPTKIVFAYSELLKGYWPVFLIVAIVLILVWSLRKRSATLHLWIDRLILRLPFIGDIIRRIETLQFCRFLQLLYENGIDVRTALAEAQGVLTNLVLVRAVSFASRQLEAGTALSKSIEMCGEFPSIVCEQLEVGEQSGNIGEALSYIVRYYDFELDYSIKTFTAFLRPALVVVMAGVLLILALGFYLPLFEIATLLNE
ncbi:MAG: type II secretion system F family protein [Lentisphaerae bacterium]|nr:type II secretion system F family protein [Lentisphaerota bacterium]MBT4821136.1 type II secretion system F family protein [Lentisphaerota bacterium]MBT5605095.1 type II secretion system F family protein [Lentisphaerota bacterium]MBT7060659.1 type II secretion system F family protein [Lentisphaerota bacterium]MBT7847348.1 type II secretion system F family protein [Lentisphaerota bacterium]